jgi:dipeptidase D
LEGILLSKLKDLGQPSEFWEYFEQITKIPRCSGQEDKVRAYVKDEAEKLGFEAQVDNTGNLVVKIPSKQKGGKGVVLQCHLDMVCEKNSGFDHDFSSDPLNLKTLEFDNEMWISAEGTTLGADNGVGIAYALTLMKKIQNGDLNFESLSFDLLFTVDEELGLRGAFKIDKDLIGGNYLINLDGEEEDSVIVGCAGGRVTYFNIKKETTEVNKTENLIPIKIFVRGLLGGHSGVDIHLGRGNAVKIIGQILWKLNNESQIKINSVDGGNRTNAITREASTVFLIKENEYSEITQMVKDLFGKIKVAFEGIEPSLDITIEKLGKNSVNEVFTKKIQDNLLNILYTIPDGPLSMHPQIRDLVFTSSNLAVIKTEKEKIQLRLSQRSLSEYFKIVIWEKVLALLQLSELEIETIIDSDYPGWTPNFNSKLLEITKDVFKELYGEEIDVKAIHAGLECGILKKKFPQMEMISIGPKNVGAHSPDERISVPSVGKIWTFVISLLRKLS